MRTNQPNPQRLSVLPSIYRPERYFQLLDKDDRPVWIERPERPTPALHAEAGDLFDNVVRTSKVFQNRYVPDKRRCTKDLLFAIKRAVYENESIVFSRREADGVTQSELQVVEAFVEAGLLVEIRSKPGGKHVTRLIPTKAARQYASRDPWDFEQPEKTHFVEMRDREDKRNLRFRKTDPIAKSTQTILKRLNDQNAKHDITFQRWSPTLEAWRPKHIRLRPTHFRIFTDDFQHHGRIYTGRYGHQGLRKEERARIRFDGELGIEVDFSGMHPRMLYHQCGIDYPNDPYVMWQRIPTDGQRLLAKKAFNALLNAESPRASIASCNSSLQITGKSRQARKDAKQLNRALAEQETSFAEVVAAVVRRHRDISDPFCDDVGMRLMRIDSDIAMEIFDYFSKLGVPCLGVHDSFIVPTEHERTLRAKMIEIYSAKLGFEPELN